MFEVDLNSLFVPRTPLFEVFLRGTIVYLLLFCVLRYLLKRQTGAIGIADLLVIVLIASSAQNALTGGQESLTEGVILVLTIVGWNHVINWLGHRHPLFRRFSRPDAVPVIKDGRVLKKNLARELITSEELLSQLHLNGVRHPAEVREAWIEGDGRLSVITFDKSASETKSSNNDPPIAA
jgi:uncharacterized membrane protein YcaP (DUF421 family)